MKGSLMHRGSRQTSPVRLPAIPLLAILCLAGITGLIGTVLPAIPAVASQQRSLANATTNSPPLQTCTAAQIRASQRYWFFGTKGAIDFGVGGTTATP